MQVEDGGRISDVQVTADALVCLRSNPGLQRGFGIEDPCARHFVTPAGRAMAQLAQSVDPVYAPYNLARYRYLGECQREAARRFPQLLRLGVGFDARGYWDPALVHADCQIFDVDYPEKLAHRQGVLANAGFTKPPHVHEVGADLAAAELGPRLEQAGVRAELPTFAVMEGVSFFLSSAVLRGALATDALRLAHGSVLLLDAWTADRIATMGARAQEQTGRQLFGEPALGADPDAMVSELRALGYTTVEVRSLAEIARDYHLDYVSDAVPDSWFILEAQVGGC